MPGGRAGSRLLAGAPMGMASLAARAAAGCAYRAGGALDRAARGYAAASRDVLRAHIVEIPVARDQHSRRALSVVTRARKTRSKCEY